MPRALLAFDTDRIKEYVFATDSLKEIRGASDILDRLNRMEMARLVDGTPYYAHGGSGLFTVPADDAEAAITRVQRAYADHTAGAASISGVALELPPDFDEDVGAIQSYWRLLGYRLAVAKARTPATRVSVTHSLLRYGDSDGTFYAAQHDLDDSTELISRVSYTKRL